CFMGKLGEVKSGDFAKSGSLFQTFLSFQPPQVHAAAGCDLPADVDFRERPGCMLYIRSSA
ncbi:hypothetical protein, partial [Stutzerimonas stutzeri]|uniref:hypothetical protein n=1 Tax=Stutzerimonas stutzeri TaxID=316 RepID=UPI001C8C7D58